ncbi:MAG: polyketide synthase dehydratase domain-containing protein [Candidatus Binatia bacterium]
MASRRCRPAARLATARSRCTHDDGTVRPRTRADVRAGRGTGAAAAGGGGRDQRRLARSLTADQVYEHLARRGFEYGAPVRVVERAWRDDGEVLAEIRRPEEGDGYCWHPLHLDACLQMALLAQPNGSRTPLLLAAIEGCSVYRVPGETAYAHVRLRRASEGFLDCDLTVFDPDGEVRAALSGVRFAAAEQSAGAAAGITYEPYWRLEHHPIRQRERRNRTSLPAPAQVVASIERAVAERPAAMPDRMEEFDRYMEDSQRMAAEIVADALAKLGWDPRPGDRFTAEGLRSQLGVSVGHERLFADYLRMFAEDGYLARDGEHWVVLAPPRRRDGEGLVAIMRASMPVREPWVDVLARCVPHLPDVLTDRLQATDVLFPGGSVEQVSDFYTNSPVFAAINRQLECVSAALVEGFPAGYRLRVLEVGAGTGAATAKLLPGLPPELTEYVYTDLSSHFFRQARQRFADYPFVHYQTLDLEQDPMAQGFAEHGHDVVIIYQVVHATNDIRQSMRARRAYCWRRRGCWSSSRSSACCRAWPRSPSA